MLRNTFLFLVASAAVSAAPAPPATTFHTDLPTREVLEADAKRDILRSRAVIDHDAVVSLPQAVPSGIVGDLMLKFQPKLKVFNGCVPFPAVDAEGNTSGGLAPTGSSNGGCSSSTGQIYSRGVTASSGEYAIMYSWYMPKDSPSTNLGHRHEWENAVVWLSGLSEDAEVVGMAVSQHGDYDHSTDPDMDGNSPLVGYISYWPVDHQMIFTSTVGGEQPLVAWDSMSSVVQAALADTDFGAATVPFKDSTFSSNIALAAL